MQVFARTLPRHARLTQSQAFTRVFKQGLRSRDAHFLVLAAASGLPHARLGLAVSKKTARRAVARNRLKRVIRESFRHHQHALAGLDLVVVAQAKSEQQPNAVLQASLRQHWNRVRKQCKVY